MIVVSIWVYKSKASIAQWLSSEEIESATRVQFLDFQQIPLVKHKSLFCGWIVGFFSFGTATRLEGKVWIQTSFTLL